MGTQKTPVISFVAKSGSGKTTLLEKVVRELKAGGYRVAVIKHDAHQFEMDRPGKDTWRMSVAGADIVAISSPGKMAIIEKVAEEKELDDVIGMIKGVDIILTEGYSLGCKPKVEVFRSGVSKQLVSNPRHLLAVASDINWEMGVPCYHLDNVGGIIEMIKGYIKGFGDQPGGHN